MRYFICILPFFIALTTIAQRFDHRSGQYVAINGAQIYYEVKGKKNAPVLLLLHGGYGNIEDFNAILPELGKEYTLIGIDSRGHGKSTLGNSSLTYELIQKDVETILQQLQVDSFSIIGFSDGGIVAYRLAALTSLKIRKIITIGSRWNIKNTEPKKGDWLEMTGDGIREKWPEDFTAYQSLNPEPDFNRFTQLMVKMWLDSTATGHPDERVKDIHCPVLMVRGGHDTYISLDDFAELSRLIRRAYVLNIPFAGHYAFKDQKEIFLIALKQFLRESAGKAHPL
jgi:pimeloyl-ACP methyl ester carboxylesterase